jgi:DNA-binding protein H-NS
MTETTTQTDPQAAIKREDPLQKMSLPALELLHDKVNRAISAHHQRLRLQETEAERAELEALAREGRPVAEPQPRTPRHPRPAQGYRHPEDSSIVWPGLGRRPAWLHAALKRGIELEDLAITASGSAAA